MVAIFWLVYIFNFSIPIFVFCCACCFIQSKCSIREISEVHESISLDFRACRLFCHRKCDRFSLLIAALIFSAGYYSAPFFYNLKNLICIGVLSFFKICSHIFMIFKSNWSSDFGHTETGSGRKKRVVLQLEFFFALILK